MKDISKKRGQKNLRRRRKKSAIRKVKGTTINTESRAIKQYLQNLDPAEYGETWGVMGSPELQAELDKVVAEELKRRDGTKSDEVGNFTFGS
ncbi:uncharacterized protein METZ01_LOCUS413230 [marine metagenome]|uniref:Uncharacterized protein n=1 Tax=marine metagenome TaxID=408172 RepID=A0A382WNA2_9ZZZZ